MSSDPTEAKQSGLIPFKPGQSGNPAGRPKGARNKLGEAFLAALADDFEAHGAAAIQKTRETKPEVYVRVCASLLPKELNVRVSDIDNLSERELDQRILAALEHLGGEGGVAAALGGEAETEGLEPAGGVSPLH